MTRLNGRWVKIVNVDAVAHTFELTDLGGAPIDTSGYDAYVSGGGAYRAYTLASPYQSDDLFDITFTQNADVITLTHESYSTRELARQGASEWSLTVANFAPASTVPTDVTATATTAQNQYLTTQKYVVTAVADDGITETLASAVASCSNNLGLAGNYNTVTWSAVSGYSRYNVYKLHGGIYGYIGNIKAADGLTLTDDNIEPDTTQSPPENIISLNGGADDYPSAVAYHEQRRWFAGTNGKPQVMFSTRTATEYNLTSSIPSRADDAMEVRIAAGQYNKIWHLVPLSDLIAFTAGGFFRIYADNAPAITPSSISIKPQGYVGASRVAPVLTTASVLYAQAQGSHIREVAYDWQSNAYKSTDVSLFAPHLFTSCRITQMAFMQAPDPTLWNVCDDGGLLGMTYVPEQQVYGWHRHDTDGFFRSDCVVSENNKDILYVVVERVIGGRTTACIERMQEREFADQAHAFFVDSGLIYEGEPTTSISGYYHLEGVEVDILADGAVLPRQTVTDGAVTLDEAASVVVVGRPIVADFRTLPLAAQAAQALGQGVPKNLNKVWLRVLDTSIVSAGPTFDRLREYPARAVSDPYGSPPSLRTGIVELGLDGAWNTEGVVCVRQTLPLPLSILSLVMEVSLGG